MWKWIRCSFILYVQLVKQKDGSQTCHLKKYIKLFLSRSCKVYLHHWLRTINTIFACACFWYSHYSQLLGMPIYFNFDQCNLFMLVYYESWDLSVTFFFLCVGVRVCVCKPIGIDYRTSYAFFKQEIKERQKWKVKHEVEVLLYIIYNWRMIPKIFFSA